MSLNPVIGHTKTGGRRIWYRYRQALSGQHGAVHPQRSNWQVINDSREMAMCFRNSIEGKKQHSEENQRSVPRPVLKRY